MDALAIRPNEATKCRKYLLFRHVVRAKQANAGSPKRADFASLSRVLSAALLCRDAAHAVHKHFEGL